MASEPLLMRSDLTGRVYVVTSYTMLANRVVEAKKKYDVTDQFEKLNERERAALTLLYGAQEETVMSGEDEALRQQVLESARGLCPWLGAGG